MVVDGQGRGNYFKVGGRGKRLPGSKVSPTQNNNFPDFPTIFWGEPQDHVKKQTQIKINNIDSSKLSGRRPHNFQTRVCELPPLPARESPHPSGRYKF